MINKELLKMMDEHTICEGCGRVPSICNCKKKENIEVFLVIFLTVAILFFSIYFYL